MYRFSICGLNYHLDKRLNYFSIALLHLESGCELSLRNKLVFCWKTVLDFSVVVISIIIRVVGCFTEMYQIWSVRQYIYIYTSVCFVYGFDGCIRRE